MNWVRNYFTPLTLLCSARHAGATPYGAAPSSGALHLCPAWQPWAPHPAVQHLRARRHTCKVQRLAARRHTCNVQRLAARRCTVTYPAPWLGPPPPPPPPHTLSLSPRALPPLPLSPPLKSSPKSCKFGEFVRGFQSQNLPQGNLLRSSCFGPSNVINLLICC